MTVKSHARRTLLRTVAIALSLIVANTVAARAELHLDITRGKIAPLPRSSRERSIRA